MPQAIDEERMQQKPVAGQDTSIMLSLDPHKPPTKYIPHMDFPRVVYKHPVEPFTTIEHRNAKHELLEEEVIPTEHLTMSVPSDEHMRDKHPSGDIVGSCAGCKAELEKAMKDGWVTEPYVPETPPDKKAALYGKSKPKSA